MDEQDRRAEISEGDTKTDVAYCHICNGPVVVTRRDFDGRGQRFAHYLTTCPSTHVRSEQVFPIG